MPTFKNISGSVIVEYKGLSGLLTHSVCKQWQQRTGFLRFSVKHTWNDSGESHVGPHITLIAEFENSHWFEVGYLSEDPELPLFTRE